MLKLTSDKRQLCDIQGRLFELSLKQNYDSPAFIETFMNSHAADVEMAIDNLKEIYQLRHNK